MEAGSGKSEFRKIAGTSSLLKTAFRRNRELGISDELVPVILLVTERMSSHDVSGVRVLNVIQKPLPDELLLSDAETRREVVLFLSQFDSSVRVVEVLDAIPLVKNDFTRGADKLFIEVLFQWDVESEVQLDLGFERHVSAMQLLCHDVQEAAKTADHSRNQVCRLTASSTALKSGMTFSRHGISPKSREYEC